jgi:hypothetical protein
MHKEDGRWLGGMPWDLSENAYIKGVYPKEFKRKN